jgi:adenylosuccinate lyase/3-carboxy-cis,cis-muconate cycloisomerase
MGTTLDHELFGDLFGTAQMRALFCGTATLQAWLDVESALAQAQAEVSEIPQAAADRIAGEAKADRFDLRELSTQILVTAHPLVPLVRELIRHCEQHGAYVHWGATTQDIVDTGLMLQCRQALSLLTLHLTGAIKALLVHANRHRTTPMAGRTHCQHAVPITFGYKVAIWIDELLRARERLNKVQKSLTGQFAGAVGTLASLPGRGASIRDGLCRKLGLQSTAVPWHVSRDRIRDITAALVELSTSAERIGLEVVQLQSTEFAEASEPISAQHVGSSTMPQKRNPHASELMAAGARLLRGAVSTLTTHGVHIHERDLSAWAPEWIAIPQAFILASGVIHHLQHIAEGLTVNPDRMGANLEFTQGQIMAESIMMRLAVHVGHEPAHEIVADATRRASAQHVDLSTIIMNDERVLAVMGRKEIEVALNPRAYLGECEAIVDAVTSETGKLGITSP